ARLDLRSTDISSALDAPSHDRYAWEPDDAPRDAHPCARTSSARRVRAPLPATTAASLARETRASTPRAPDAASPIPVAGPRSRAQAPRFVPRASRPLNDRSRNVWIALNRLPSKIDLTKWALTYIKQGCVGRGGCLTDPGVLHRNRVTGVFGREFGP